MMVKRELIEDIGGFDPTIHMYGEDLEWCVRINRSKWKIWFEPEAEIYHFGGKSAEQRWSGSEIQMVQEAAAINFHRKCFSTALNLSNGLTTTFVMSMHYLRWKVTRRDTSILSQLIRLHLKNCKELIVGSFRDA